MVYDRRQIRDVGYKQPSQHDRAQDVQKLSFTPGHHRHVKTYSTIPAVHLLSICKGHQAP